MKRLLIIAGLLSLTACVPEDTSRMYVSCNKREANGKLGAITWSGRTKGGIGVAQSKYGKAFLVFKDEADQQVILDLNDQVCGIVSIR